MYTPEFVPLPSPHEDVLFRHVVTDQYVCAQYLGAPVALVDAGAIDRFMIGRGSMSLHGIDANGERFRRCPYGNGTLRIDRFARSYVHARTLPGVPRECTTPLITWLKAHPGELHFDIEDRFECVSGTRELLIAHRHARRETFEGRFGFWGSCDEHADAGPEQWRCYVDRLLDGYYRIRRSRYGDWDRMHLSREDMTQALRAYARYELKKLLAMARGESHRGIYEIPEPSVRLLEQYASEIDQAFEQAASTLAVQSNVVQLR